MRMIQKVCLGAGSVCATRMPGRRHQLCLTRARVNNSIIIVTDTYYYSNNSNPSKMPRIIKERTDNEFESSDEEYMNEVNSDFELFVESCDEDISGVIKQTNPKKKIIYNSDPGPSIPPSSDSSEEINTRAIPRVYRVLSSSDDESELQSRFLLPVIHNSPRVWKNVTLNDNYCADINFSVGQKSVGPQVPSNCTTPLQYFQLFFTEELIQKITLETNKYATNILATKSLSKFSIWNKWSPVTREEMRAFLGVIINMGLIDVPELKEYWSRAFHKKIPFFGKIFTRRRFLQIFWSLHLETISSGMQEFRTRIQRVNNFLMYLEGKFREHLVPDENLSVDESTVGFKGRFMYISFNPKKPTKWGLRIYVLADSKTSYVYSFVPYYGKITTDALIRPDLSFTSRIVLHLYNNLKLSIPNAAGYHIFTDRFYTNLVLAKELLDLKCYLTGTIMVNRIGLPDEVKKPKLAKGNKIAFRKKKIMVMAWRDQRVVTMLSTWCDTSSETVRRRPRSTRRAVRRAIRGRTLNIQPTETPEEIQKPRVVLKYNKNMGGVDVADQYATSYCFMRKTLKWWRKLFFWGMETSIINSYILYNQRATQEGGKAISHIKFREELLLSLVGDFRAPTIKTGRVSTTDREQRLDEKGHFLYPNPQGKHKDCLVCSNRKIPGGRKETRYICVTCERKPGLCIGECFHRYHTLDVYNM